MEETPRRLISAVREEEFGGEEGWREEEWREEGEGWREEGEGWAGEGGLVRGGRGRMAMLGSMGLPDTVCV